MEQCRISFLCVSVWIYRVWEHNNKKRGVGGGGESNGPTSHASDRAEVGWDRKMRQKNKKQKKGLTREKKKVEMQVTQKQRAGGEKNNRQVLIFLLR